MDTLENTYHNLRLLLDEIRDHAKWLEVAAMAGETDRDRLRAIITLTDEGAEAVTQLLGDQEE